MKRQERLSLFFTREEQVLAKILPNFSGFAGLYFGGRSLPQLKAPKIKHFFRATNRKVADTELIFDAQEWPLPRDFFDCILLDHPLDLGFEMQETLKEAVRVLRKDGVITITGFNKTRLCSWPVQNSFGRELSCPIKRYSSLQILGLLEAQGFAAEICYFDFCRYHFWNKVFSKVIPFLGIGFVITATRRVVDLKPLDETLFNFAAAKEVLQPKAQPEYLGEKTYAED